MIEPDVTSFRHAVGTDSKSTSARVPGSSAQTHVCDCPLVRSGLRAESRLEYLTICAYLLENAGRRLQRPPERRYTNRRWLSVDRDPRGASALRRRSVCPVGSTGRPKASIQRGPRPPWRSRRQPLDWHKNRAGTVERRPADQLPRCGKRDCRSFRGSARDGEGCSIRSE